MGLNGEPVAAIAVSPEESAAQARACNLSGQLSGPHLLGKLRTGRCLFLMISLIGMLLSYPWLDTNRISGLAANILLLTAGVYALSRSRVRAFTVGGLGLAHLVLAGAAIQTRSFAFLVPAVLFLMAFQACTIVIVLRYVLRGRTVTTDKIFGAVSVYLLLGFLWASAYTLVLIWKPDTFGPLRVGETGKDLIYFSFVTLATIGYGDITAGPGPARALAILESITGVFYIAVLVSRLVNAFESEPEDTREEP